MISLRATSQADVDASVPAPTPSIPSVDLSALESALRIETERLTQALEAQEQQGAALQAEIDALREELNNALDSRDERSEQELAELRAELARLQASEEIPTGRQVAATIALTALTRSG